MIHHLFGSSGIRGDAVSLFTEQFSFDIGRTFSIFLDKYNQPGPVAVGMDPRESSPRIQNAVVSGLCYEKKNVVEEGILPIPAVNYCLIKNPNYAGSLMITGSHIKSNLNGIKFFAFKQEILKIHEKEIEDIYFKICNKVKYYPIASRIKPKLSAVNYYQEHLKALAKNHNFPLKIVVDAGNGAQSEVIPELLKEAGHQVIKENCSYSSPLISRDTEVENDFIEFTTLIKKHRADLGIAFDSDGDRVIFSDEAGNLIPGDYSGTLIAREIKSDWIVTPINTSQVIDHVGKKIFRTKVGSPNVVEKMKQLNSDFGFEANGGGIFKDMLSRDGGRTMVEIINIIGRERVSFGKIVSTLPKYFLNRDKIDYDSKDREKILKAAKKEFLGIKIEEIDGLKIWINNNSWILFRASSNASEFRVFAESTQHDVSLKLLQRGINFVKNAINNRN